MDARDRILDAFRELVFSRHYDEFKTVDIISGAGVARATFYSHFRNKDDVLLRSVQRILDVFAAAYRGAVEPAKLKDTLEHIWQNRALGRAVWRPPIADQLVNALVQTVQGNTSANARAVFAFSGLIGLLGAWTSGRVSMTVDEMSVEVTQFMIPPVCEPR